MYMNTIFKKHVVGLIILIIVAIFILIGIIFFFSSMNQKVVRVLDVKERISSYEKNKKEFADEVAQLKTFENKLSALESYVVTSGSVPDLLSTFETLAQKQNLTFEIASVQTPVENEKTKLLVEFNIRSGSFPQIQSFLNELQHQAFQVNFIKLSVNSDSTPTVPEVPTQDGATPKAPIVSKERNWQAVATIEILSF